MKVIRTLILLSALAYAAGPAAAAQEHHKDMKMSKPMGKAQTVCPVSGKPIDKSVYVDHDGKRVYFCCSDCEKAFKKDPEAMIKKMEAKGLQLASTQDHGTAAQTVCPVTGNPVETDVYVDFKGKRVYFCCPSCEKEFKKDPDAMIKKMESEGVKLAETPAK